MSFLSSYFQFEKLGTSFRKEVVAGLTTFVAMSYILFLNPTVLGDAGMNKGAVFTATALASGIATIFMGLVARYPIAIAPGLGVNAFFAYSVVIGMGVKWQTAMAGILVAAIIFLLLTMFKIREKIIDAIPSDLKIAIAAGIGLFIAFIGLHNAGLIVANKDTMVAMGSLTNANTLLAIFGIVLTLVLLAVNTPAAIFVGMIGTTIVGFIFGLIKMPSSIIGSVPSLKPTFGESINYLGHINTFQMWIVVLTFLIVTFFDTAGTLIGLAEQAGFMENNKMPRAGKALMADAVGMTAGAVLGTSPTSAYVESSSGIAVGGRSGLTSVVTGLLFFAALIFSPLLSVVTDAVTAPALVIVGIMMAKNLQKIQWDDLAVAAPAFLVVVGMPLTYSISDGIALGFIVYPITMIATKRAKEVNWLMYLLAIIFVLFLYSTHS
ncbi:NCS2 family permease [Fructobacillus evanidus]|uniref:Nucleobase:cation symporter 2 ( NCS2) family (NCS2) n=1 Tax=Fructobacillus evanidus TaxID=3064281 RepID=A0ABM9MR69_9LACO|nr:Xanthine/guanine/uracil/vitamin C permease GhxP/GhxQ [Fructobacillus sp. LMG 32999]CAK1230470.1 Xanthine/guanine/uracil/vitamin C permease GhxP/GhxQ [Fructobacillus sp. LMG 32999]CAK1234186.1 Xanthine/guanine/uracil/vitamin C permease GhxP/GhxQ [Fructobacillus sp. LMG 32999]CAK1236390.1 Xanthine/guanine/uracil/vitamin C permease GhxP/GhxQ [Fructobacillus sp. LMG 32999]CAK1238189.1 Xanthine/guanine/uracil/vitamin C permease GhxP/GhxQ [Fructobacillus sp. LMG 32999]